jgi:hypothetical protein
MKRTYLIVRLTVMTGLLVAALVTPDRERDAAYSATVTSEDGMCYVQHAHERHEMKRNLTS